MITFLFSRGRNVLNQCLLLTGMLLTWSGAFSQLDSVSISISFTEDVSLDSLQVGNDTVDILNVAVYTDDIDFLGEILVTVYDLSSGHPIAQIESTKAEMEALSAISGSTSTIEFPDFPPIVGSYRIDVLVRNFQGGNLPLVSTTY